MAPGAWYDGEGRVYEGEPRSPPVQRAGRPSSRARGLRARRDGSPASRWPWRATACGSSHAARARPWSWAGSALRVPSRAPRGGCCPHGGPARVHGRGEHRDCRVVQADEEGAERSVVAAGPCLAHDARVGTAPGVGARRRAAAGARLALYALASAATGAGGALFRVEVDRVLGWVGTQETLYQVMLGTVAAAALLSTARP